MNVPAAWVSVLAGSALILVTAFVLRPRIAQPATDALLGVGGVAIGLGGLLFFEDVTAAEWVITPLLLASWAIVHARAMFAGAGPLRT